MQYIWGAEWDIYVYCAVCFENSGENWPSIIIRETAMIKISNVKVTSDCICNICAVCFKDSLELNLYC